MKQVTQSFVFSEMHRQMQNLIKFGTIKEIDHKKARVKVATGKVITNWIPWITTAGSIKVWNPLSIGEQVLVISQSGDHSVGVAIPSIYQNKFSSPSDKENVIKLELSNKTSIEFDKDSDEFLLKIDDTKIIVGSEKIGIELGNAEIKVESDGIKFSVGKSEIEITAEKIKLNAPIIEAPSLKAGF